MMVELRNKVTGEIKTVKIGWSWTCFLFSPILGIPLFIRRLNAWAGVMVVLWVLNFVAPELSKTELDYWILTGGIYLIQIGFMIFFGVAANRMAGKNHLESGWEFAEPTSTSTAIAREAWGLPRVVDHAAPASV